MRTMYFAYEESYADPEGYHTEFENRGKFDTFEEAKKATENFHGHGGWYTGDWKIVAKTMDEATFTFKEETVEEFDWYEEVGKKEYAKEKIERWTKKIAEIEESKKRCRTENGIVKKDKEIVKYKEWIEKEKVKIA